MTRRRLCASRLRVFAHASGTKILMTTVNGDQHFRQPWQVMRCETNFIHRMILRSIHLYFYCKVMNNLMSSAMRMVLFLRSTADFSALLHILIALVLKYVLWPICVAIFLTSFKHRDVLPFAANNDRRLPDVSSESNRAQPGHHRSASQSSHSPARAPLSSHPVWE